MCSKKHSNTSRAASREILSRDNITTKKPGSGIPARKFNEMLGRKAVNALPADYLLTENDISD